MKNQNANHPSNQANPTSTSPDPHSVFVINADGTRQKITPSELLSEYLMKPIGDDDEKALSSVFAFAKGLAIDPLSVELPLKELATGEETMVSMPLMCFALGKEACFDFLIDKLLEASLESRQTLSLFHSLFRELAPNLGSPDYPPVQARMLDKLVEGFMLAAQSHGELDLIFGMAIPEPILAVARRVANQGTSSSAAS